MTWLSINPNAISEETMQVCADILYEGCRNTKRYPLNSTEIAFAFNVLDLEVTGLTHSSNHGITNRAQRKIEKSRD